MREEPTRSLLLLDANADERRLISAIAARAGWSVVGAADEETALALLQGPHGREVQAALLGSWDSERGPQLIAALARASRRPAGHRPVARRHRFRRGRGDARRRVRFPGAAGGVRAAARGARRQCRPPPRRGRARAGVGEARAAARARAADRRRARIPHRPGGRRQIGAQPPAGADHRRSRAPARKRVARAIHAASLRAKGPLLSLDCKAIPANIIDSELFGHEKGRVPGRVRGQDRQARPGRRRHARSRRDRVRCRQQTQELLDRVLATGEVRPGRPQRQPFGRRPRDRHQQPAASRGFPCRPRRADQRDHRDLAARCASAAATSPRSPATCSTAWPSRPASSRCRSAMTRWPC